MSATVSIYLDTSPRGVGTPLNCQPGVAYSHADDAACPHCGTNPLRVYGTDAQWATHDTIEGFGRCFDCKKSLGLIVAVVGGTIFGAQEDAAVIAEIEERGGRIYR